MALQLLLYFLICLLATTIGGLSGVGGGVIIKPVLDAMATIPVSTISFLSGSTVLAMAITSLQRSRGGSVHIERRRGTLLALGSAVGGLVGKGIFDWIEGSGGPLISVAQQILMILLTLGVLVYSLNRSRITTLNVTHGLLCASIGLLLGLLSSFLGIGGGPINLAILYYFFSMDTKTAALNSLYIIFFSQTASLLNSLIWNKIPTFDPWILCVMVAGGILGGILGRSISSRLSNQTMDRLFFALLILITAISFYNLWQCLPG